VTAFGYLLPTRELLMSQAIPDFGQILHLAEQAEGIGFDSVWVGDSVLARPRFEALTTLAAIAARTRQVKIGTAVLTPALRQPVVQANEIANVDHVSRGRLILGLGIAGNSPANVREFEACGYPIAHRAGLFAEGVTLMRRLWSEPEVTFAGRYFKVDSVRLGLRPLQQPSPPLWFAGSVDSAFRRLLRLGDGWFPISPPPVYATHWARIRELGDEMGRDANELHRAIYTTLNINPDAAEAERELRTFMEGYYGTSYDTLSGRTSLCAGTAEGCTAWLNAYVDAGVQTIVVRFGGPDQVSQLERFVKDVMPNVT
jgi:alkanesulfonate monooxygenase SsuD/methylene tetrahydromethanopterin reductase-like flavin-dependent oxidoreductase (luciferase family)